MDYYQKYLKYKNKYLDLKNNTLFQTGGMVGEILDKNLKDNIINSVEEYIKNAPPPVDPDSDEMPPLPQITRERLNYTDVMNAKQHMNMNGLSFYVVYICPQEIIIFYKKNENNFFEIHCELNALNIYEITRIKHV